MIGQRYEAEKLANCFRGNQYALADKSASGQNDPKQKSERTSECIAREINTSESYVRRAERYAKGVDAAEEIEPGIKQELLSGSIRPTDTAVAAIGKANLDDRPALVNSYVSQRSYQIKHPPQFKSKYRQRLSLHQSLMMRLSQSQSRKNLSFLPAP